VKATDFYFYHRFVLPAIVPLILLVAIGISRWRSCWLTGLAFFAFIFLTFSQNRLLLTRSYAPFREVAAAMSLTAKSSKAPPLFAAYGLGSHVMQPYLPGLRDIRTNPGPVLQDLINQARQEYTAATASAASADARVAAAQAKLDAARLDLSRTEVRAAIDGAIANNTVVPGALVSPGQQVVSIVPTDDAYIIANYKETQVARMAPRQHVRLKVDAYPDLKCTGTVDSIAPASGGTFSLIPQDTATGNFTKIVQRVPVKILIDKDCLATGKMRSGLSVVATISTKAS
jgi:hypothetical protein